MVRRFFAAVVLLLGGCLASFAGTLNFNFTGNFTYDNDVQLFTVTLAVPETLTAWTTSGATGGFPTYLAMFDGAGNGMTQQSGDPTCLNGFSSYSPAGCNDAEVSEPPSGTIAAGTYIIALTQWDNGMLGNLSDGFFYVDLIPDPNFTAENGCDGTGYFCDPGTMTYDSSNWALTIQLSNPDLPALGSASEEGLSPIPEPSSALLVMGGLAAAWYMRSRKRRA
jgi:hypothetical protein